MAEFIWAVFLTVLESLAAMLLWNWLMPFLFHLPTINYIEAVGLFLLAQTLFVGKPKLEDLDL